jgi:hypothetical protein
LPLVKYYVGKLSRNTIYSLPNQLHGSGLGLHAFAKNGMVGSLIMKSSRLSSIVMLFINSFNSTELA